MTVTPGSTTAASTLSVELPPAVHSGHGSLLDPLRHQRAQYPPDEVDDPDALGFTFSTQLASMVDAAAMAVATVASVSPLPSRNDISRHGTAPLPPRPGSELVHNAGYQRTSISTLAALAATHPADLPVQALLDEDSSTVSISSSSDHDDDLPSPAPSTAASLLAGGAARLAAAAASGSGSFASGDTAAAGSRHGRQHAATHGHGHGHGLSTRHAEEAAFIRGTLSALKQATLAGFEEAGDAHFLPGLPRVWFNQGSARGQGLGPATHAAAAAAPGPGGSGHGGAASQAPPSRLALNPIVHEANLAALFAGATTDAHGSGVGGVSSGAAGLQSAFALATGSGLPSPAGRPGGSGAPSPVVRAHSGGRGGGAGFRLGLFQQVLANSGSIAGSSGPSSLRNATSLPLAPSGAAAEAVNGPPSASPSPLVHSQAQPGSGHASARSDRMPPSSTSSVAAHAATAGGPPPVAVPSASSSAGGSVCGGSGSGSGFGDGGRRLLAGYPHAGSPHSRGSGVGAGASGSGLPQAETQYADVLQQIFARAQQHLKQQQQVLLQRAQHQQHQQQGPALPPAAPARSLLKRARQQSHGAREGPTALAAAELHAAGAERHVARAADASADGSREGKAREVIVDEAVRGPALRKRRGQEHLHVVTSSQQPQRMQQARSGTAADPVSSIKLVERPAPPTDLGPGAPALASGGVGQAAPSGGSAPLPSSKAASTHGGPRPDGAGDGNKVGADGASAASSLRGLEARGEHGPRQSVRRWQDPATGPPRVVDPLLVPPDGLIADITLTLLPDSDDRTPANQPLGRQPPPPTAIPASGDAASVRQEMRLASQWPAEQSAPGLPARVLQTSAAPPPDAEQPEPLAPTAAPALAAGLPSAPLPAAATAAEAEVAAFASQLQAGQREVLVQLVRDKWSPFSFPMLSGPTAAAKQPIAFPPLPPPATHDAPALLPLVPHLPAVAAEAVAARPAASTKPQESPGTGVTNASEAVSVGLLQAQTAELVTPRVATAAAPPSPARLAFGSPIVDACSPPPEDAPPRPAEGSSTGGGGGSDGGPYSSRAGCAGDGGPLSGASDGGGGIAGGPKSDSRGGGGGDGGPNRGSGGGDGGPNSGGGGGDADVSGPCSVGGDVTGGSDAGNRSLPGRDGSWQSSFRALSTNLSWKTAGGAPVTVSRESVDGGSKAAGGDGAGGDGASASRRGGEGVGAAVPSGFDPSFSLLKIPLPDDAPAPSGAVPWPLASPEKQDATFAAEHASPTAQHDQRRPLPIGNAPNLGVTGPVAAVGAAAPPALMHFPDPQPVEELPDPDPDPQADAVPQLSGADLRTVRELVQRKWSPFSDLALGFGFPPVVRPQEVAAAPPPSMPSPSPFGAAALRAFAPLPDPLGFAGPAAGVPGGDGLPDGTEEATTASFYFERLGNEREGYDVGDV